MNVGSKQFPDTQLFLRWSAEHAASPNDPRHAITTARMVNRFRITLIFGLSWKMLSNSSSIKLYWNVTEGSIIGKLCLETIVMPWSSSPFSTKAGLRHRQVKRESPPRNSSACRCHSHNKQWADLLFDTLEVKVFDNTNDLVFLFGSK